MSAGSASRPSMVWLRNCSSRASGTVFIMSVMVHPGAMALTRTALPPRENSLAQVLVMPMSPALAAA